MPEILDLFLNLSDRPDQKSTLDSLNLLRSPSPPPSPITWAEILADDPLTGDIWQDESYSSFSEDDIEIVEVSVYDKKDANNRRDDELKTQDPKALLVTVPMDSVAKLKAAQFWNHSNLQNSRPQETSELQVIREVLLMLRGLPTSLFAIDSQHTLVYHSMNVVLAQVSLSSLNDLLQSFADIGSDLFRLRTWIRKGQSIPLLQAFNHSLSTRIRVLDRSISEIEQRVTAPTTAVVVSILHLHQEILALARPFGPLEEVAASVPDRGGDFICLESLYDHICMLQAAGDDECYEFLGTIFFECLRVYLRPVSLWMEEGSISNNDSGFFVSIADKTSATSTLWHDRYTLRTTADGDLHAPSFLHPAAQKILNAGKSIVFLQQLKCAVPTLPGLAHAHLTLKNVCGHAHLASLMPFSELFGAAFLDWIGNKYGPASSILKRQLITENGLLRHLDVLEHVYFSKDGVRFQSFADELFQRMDKRKAVWSDKFLLSELARSVFGSLDHVQAEALNVRVVPTKHTARSVKALSAIQIDVALPWPIQNIIQRFSMATYQRVFRMILQIYRANYLLKLDSFNLRQFGGQYSRTCNAIRQRLIWFTNILHSYITETVVQAAMEKFRNDLESAEDVDAMSALHENLTKKLQSRCLLAKNLAPIHDSIIAVLDLAVAYSDAQTSKLTIASDGSMLPKSQRSFIDSRRGRRRRRGKPETSANKSDSSSSDSSDEDADYDADTEKPSQREEPYEERLQKIYEQFSQLLQFIVAGLRGVSRAGGEMSWEMLAERLEWGVQKTSLSTSYG